MTGLDDVLLDCGYINVFAELGANLTKFMC